MTKEQLEEIRKQKGTVYTVFDGDKEATALVLDEKCNDNNILAQAYFCLSNLFETKERAEWYCKTTAERIERFEPPMWKDLLEKDLYVFTFVKDGEVYDFICNNYLDKVDIRLEQRLVGYSSKPVTACQFNDATKENYEKACEIVRGLFSGSNG